MLLPSILRRSPGMATAAFGLLACLPLSADDCIPDPADGIYCGGQGPDPTSFQTYTIYGDESATWTASTLTAGITYYYSIQPGATLRVTGDANDYYRATTFVTGDGDFYLVGGYLRAHSITVGQIYLTNSHLASSLNGGSGGNWLPTSVLHLTDATLHLVRDPDYYANIIANPFVLSGQARIEADSLIWEDPNKVAVSFAGAISGDGTLTTGTGHLSLKGTNTYSGGTRIEAGDLEVWTDANLGAADTAVTFAANAGLWLNDGFASSARATTFEGGIAYVGVRSGAASWTGLISGDGGLVKTGPGTLTLTAANTYAAGTTVLGGALAVSADTNLGAADSAVTLANGTTLIATSGFTSSARLLTFSGTTATVETATGTLTWQGATAGPGKLLKTGAGTLVLAGGTGHTGGADIAAGALEVSVSEALGGTGTTTWSGPITGSGAFTKSGAGTLELSGAATLTGGTFLRGGTLRTTAANVLSATSAYFLIGGSTLDLAGFDQTVGDLDSYNQATSAVEASTVDLGGATLTNLTRVINLWAGDLTGTGTVVKKGTAEMKWYAANTFTGTLRVDAGTVSAQAAGVFSPHAVAELATGTTLKLNSYDQTIAGLAGAGTVALGSAALTTDQSVDTTFSGAITGTGALVKSGAGTLALTGTNTFTGGITLADGVLQLGSTGALGSSGTIALTGGTLRFTAANTTDYSARFSTAANQSYRFDTNGQDVTLASDLTSSGASLTKLGTGTLTLSGTSTYAGGTVLQQGVLAVDRDAALGGSAGAVTFDGGTLRATGSFNASRNTTLADGGGTFDVLASHTLTWDGAISGGGALQKTGAGVLTLGGANTYSGATAVQAGTLRLASASALSPHTSLAIAPGARFEAGSYAPTLTNVTGGGTLDTGSAGVTFAPTSSATLGVTLTGAGGFTKVGTATLTGGGTHDYTGATVVSAGRLIMNGTASGSAFTVSPGATLGGSGTLGGLTLSSGGFVAPGNSPGTLTVAGDVTWAGGATYVWEINSANGSAGTHWDLLSISGTLNLAATAEQPFTIALTSLTPANLAGTVVDFNAARDYDFVFATAAGGIAGFNTSSFALDLSAFANPYAGTWSVASDGSSLSVHYSASAIPEPATWTALAGLAALGFALVRRRRSA